MGKIDTIVAKALELATEKKASDDLRPPAKEFQGQAIKRLFERLNPVIDSSVIDFEAFVDANLSLEANIQLFKERFPVYR